MSERSKPTRGRPSKIDRLPNDVKQALDAMLRQGYSQTEILDAINEEIDQAGTGDTISRSGLNRYATRMESVGKEIRETRELADMWISKLGTKPTGDVTKLLLEMLRTNAFKIMMKHAEDPNAVMDVGMIKDLSLGIQRLENASLSSHKREKEIRQVMAEEAATLAEQAAVAAGASAEGAAMIKQQILGIV
jgi:hypothetical protein